MPPQMPDTLSKFSTGQWSPATGQAIASGINDPVRLSQLGTNATNAAEQAEQIALRLEEHFRIAHGFAAPPASRAPESSGPEPSDLVRAANAAVTLRLGAALARLVALADFADKTQ